MTNAPHLADVRPPPTYIRGPRKTDQSFIAATWVKQLGNYDRRGAIGARHGTHGRNVDALLDRADTRAIIRHAPGDPDAIFAWLVYAEGPGVPLVHFAYTRKDWRERGYARALLAHIGVHADTSWVYTSRGPMADKLLRSYRGAAFLPLQEFFA